MSVSSPGSKSGAEPLASASTTVLDSSTPTTRWPTSAQHAESTDPRCHNPTTQMVSARSIAHSCPKALVEEWGVDRPYGALHDPTVKRVPGGHQRRKHVIAEIAGDGVGDQAQNLGGEDVQAPVDEPAEDFRGRRLFRETPDPPVLGERDDPGAGDVVFLEQRDCPDAAALPVELRQPGEIAFEVVVAVDDEERVIAVQQRSEVPDRPRRTQQRRLIGVRERDTPASAVSAILGEDFGAVMEIHEHFTNPTLRHHLEHPVDHGAAA